MCTLFTGQTSKEGFLMPAASATALAQSAGLLARFCGPLDFQRAFVVRWTASVTTKCKGVTDLISDPFTVDIYEKL